MPVGSAYRGPIVPLAHGDQVARRAVEEVTRRFGPAVKERTTFRGEETLLLEASRLVEACAFLKDDPDLRFDVLTDVMAAHFLDRDYDYEVAYVLSSYPNNAVLRLKVRAGGRLGPGSVPTVTGVWATADWQEREEWDKVGVLFSGHPNLQRILMPDDWEGHPLRRDYPMEGIGA